MIIFLYTCKLDKIKLHVLILAPLKLLYAYNSTVSGKNYNYCKLAFSCILYLRCEDRYECNCSLQHTQFITMVNYSTGLVHFLY